MKVSHESPLALLVDSLYYNDYQYLLPTLLKFPEYAEFMKNYKGDIMMDNGLFEGDLFSDQVLLTMIDEYKPKIFITPDVWNDSDETLANLIKWKKYNTPGTSLMPVIQAKTLEEALSLFSCYKVLKCDYIAINHSSVMYESLFPHHNKLISQCFGRIRFINELINQNLVKDVNIHLLGCSIPQELNYYPRGLIYSIDTSNPIAYGLEYGTYHAGDQFFIKPTLKIEDYFYNEFSLDEKNSMQHNIIEFKERVEYGYSYKA